MWRHRYLALDSVVGAATAEAYGDTFAQQSKPSTQTEVRQQAAAHHVCLMFIGWLAIESTLNAQLRA